MPPARMRVAALLAAVATAAAVSGCGGSSTPQTPDQHHGTAPDAELTVHDAADVNFAQHMIPHHQQAVDMSAMVPLHTDNHDLIVMAKHISLDQQAEIDTLRDLLTRWGAPASPDHGDQHPMGADGMVDAVTMAKLPTLHGAQFDDLWLRSMISHHQGAITMSQPEIASGANLRAVKMAKNIVQWQEFEIGQMHAMLGPAQ